MFMRILHSQENCFSYHFCRLGYFPCVYWGIENSHVRGPSPATYSEAPEGLVGVAANQANRAAVDALGALLKASEVTLRGGDHADHP